MAAHDDVKKLAALARVDVPLGKLAAFAAEFESILAYVGKLEELSLSHETPSAGEIRNALREDGEPHPAGAYTERIAEQFPEREGDHLSVKQIITHE